MATQKKKAAPRKAAANKTASKKAAAKKPPAKKTPAVVKGKTVDAYIAGLDDWRGEAVAALRQIVRKAAPKAAESIKWAQPVYESNGPFLFIRAHKAHVNFGFWRGAQLKDPQGLLEGDGERMRHIKVTGLKDIRAKEFRRLVKEAAQLNARHGDPTRRG